MTRQDMYFSTHMNTWWKQPVKDQSSLQTAIDFIRKNMSPDEVFSKKELQIFYEDNKHHLENKLPVNY